VVRSIDRGVVKDIEFILTNSEYTRERVVKYFGRTDAESLDSSLEYELYKNLGDGRFFFYPARFSPNKQQDFALDAFAIFKRLTGKQGERYRLVLAGPLTKDKAYHAYFESLRRKAKAVGNVELLVNITDEKLRDLFGRCTAGLYPPLHEDYGLVPLEAMASGKPIIALDEGGPRHTVVKGKTGYLVKTPKEMAERMLEIADNPSFAQAMGKAGRRRVVKHYGYDRFFEIYDKRLRQVAKA